MVLLRPTSNHRILLCSPPLLHHVPPEQPHKEVPAAQPAPGQPACPCKVPTTREDSGAPSDQRGTQGGTHAGAEGASRRLGRAQCESQSNSSLLSVAPPPGTAPGILCPTSSLPHSHILIDVYYLSVTPSRGRGTTSRGSPRGRPRQQSRRRKSPRSRRSRAHSC